MEKINKKSAPRQKVTAIDREGAWGRVEYLHRLECGHTERRKRPAKTGVIACSWCVVAEKQTEVLQGFAVARPSTPPEDDLFDRLGSLIAVSEKEVAKLRAELASAFDVPIEYVDVAVEDEDGTLSVSYAVLFIPAQDISTLLAKRLDTSDEIG